MLACPSELTSTPDIWCLVFEAVCCAGGCLVDAEGGGGARLGAVGAHDPGTAPAGPRPIARWALGDQCLLQNRSNIQRCFKGRAAACRSCDKVYCCAGVCSAAVAALIALITPLPYSADFRPYFTIHDPAFAQLASQQLPTNANSLPRLLGVTNLFFLKVQPNLLLFAACAPAAKDIVITVQRCLCQYDNV